jgi:hypothetical protein
MCVHTYIDLHMYVCTYVIWSDGNDEGRAGEAMRVVR